MDALNAFSWATGRTIINAASTAILGALTVLLSAGPASSADRLAGADVSVDAKSFRCITKMTSVRHFYVDNLRGDLAATLAAANAPTGAVYPPGSVVQLIPGEAMVKRAKGFNPATRELDARSGDEDSSTSSIGSAATASGATS
jgi:hypothetical protein